MPTNDQRKSYITVTSADEFTYCHIIVILSEAEKDHSSIKLPQLKAMLILGTINAIEQY